MVKIKVAELFAGVGGFRLGLEAANSKKSLSKYEVVWFNQWEPASKEQHAWNVYRREFHWRGDLKHGNTNTDISQVCVEDIPAMDLLVGGFPCQDYSVARPANQADGLGGKKGVLWWQIERIVREKGKKAPSYLMLENVDRLLKSPTKQRGRDFAIMLASLANLGYIVEWRVINAAEYGMPQRRRRIFIMGYHPRTAIYKRIKKLEDPFDWVLKDGVMSGAFPVENADKEHCLSFALKSDLVELTEHFGDTCHVYDPFENAGIMVGHKVITGSVDPHYKGKRVNLGDILISVDKVPEEFFINDKDLVRWEYLKGPKHEERHTKDGHVYHYDEGGMIFPDALDRPSRTIITSEGGSTPSRFKHVIKQGGRLRRLTPVELERLNGFPDDHTKGLSDNKRAFMMGNALVVGVVQRLGRSLTASMTK